MDVKPIATIFNDFPEKFGLPRQSGMAEHLLSKIVMEPEYRDPEAFRGIEEYSHIWLLWEFDPLGKEGSPARNWSPTVRPPKLGGNERLGVFATRSPNRPNRIGMTVVKLISFHVDREEGAVLTVAGGDLASGTAVLDIKPYIPYADSIPAAEDGLRGKRREEKLRVTFSCPVPEDMDENARLCLEEVLSLDPRPGYQKDPDRVYGMSYGRYTVRFKAEGRELTVLSIG